MFRPKALTPDQTDLYVDLNVARGGDANVVDRLHFDLTVAEAASHRVLAGHKGSGKTTELLRLKQKLEKDGQFVVHCEADHDIDRNDVDFPELLLAIVRQMAEQLREHADITLQPGYFRDRLSRIKNLLTSEIEFDKMSLDVAIGKICTSLKNSPDTRTAVRQALEPDTGNLLQAANDVIDEAEERLRVKGYKRLTMLVDDLDKMVVRPHDRADCPTDIHLFVHRAAQLTGFGCHVVYTLPLSIAYSHHANTVERHFGGVPVLPMLKITRPQTGEPHGPGMDACREIIEKRLRSVGSKWDRLFADAKARDAAIALAGGQPRELMGIVREALTHGRALPLGISKIQDLRKRRQRDFSIRLSERDWEVVDWVTQNPFDRPRNEDQDEVFRDLLHTQMILQYVNDRIWYAPDPAVADVLRQRRERLDGS